MSNDQSAPAARSAGDGKAMADELGGGNLDKVRDILFGAQLRDSDRRFGRLEERIAQETADLKEEVRKRLGVLEQYVKQEIESLADRLKAEHEARADGDKDLSRELRDHAKATEKRFGQVEDQAGKAQRELRQQMLDMHQRISDDIARQVNDVLARLAREAAELRSDKVDRAALASMLTEMAMRLNNELSLPSVKGD